MERNILDFIEHHVGIVRGVERASAEARWKMLVVGDDEARRSWAEKREELAAIYGDREQYSRVRAYDEESGERTPILQRQLRLLLLRYADAQISDVVRARLADAAENIARTARTWRVRVDGDLVPLAEARRILDESTSGAVRRRTWEAAMKLGDAVGPELTRLVGVRNRTARDLGYTDYHDMSQRFAELEGIDDVVNDVLAAAAPAHRRFRKEVDAEVGERLGVPASGLVPWHFGGFWVESVPGRRAPDMDRYLSGDPIATARCLFEGIGIDIEPVLTAGDVAAEATHGRPADLVLLDRDAGETRLRCVVGPGGEELDRLVELLVRAIATRHVDADLPWVLREAPHDVVTKAVARVIARMARSPEFLASRDAANKSTITRMTNREAEHARGRELLGMHVRCAATRFEGELYGDPGQDLERVWWDGVRGVLGVGEPEGRHGHFDWATRLELAVNPLENARDVVVRLAAAQLEAALREELGGDAWGDPDIGAFLRERGFAPGGSLDWRGAIGRLTGKSLSPAAWVASIADDREGK